MVREQNFWKILADTLSREFAEAKSEIERLSSERDEARKAARACWVAMDWDHQYLENHRGELLEQWPWLQEKAGCEG